MAIMVQNCAGDGKTTFPTLFLCYVFHILYSAKSFLCFKFLRDRGSDFYKGTEQVDGDIFTFFFYTGEKTEASISIVNRRPRA